jgi:hypothetical protein
MKRFMKIGQSPMSFTKESGTTIRLLVHMGQAKMIDHLGLSSLTNQTSRWMQKLHIKVTKT